MVQELNNFITQKKEHSNALDAKKELVAESSSRGQQKPLGGECFCSSCNVKESTQPSGKSVRCKILHLQNVLCYVCIPRKS